jgi:hypothetical protein
MRFQTTPLLIPRPIRVAWPHEIDSAPRSNAYTPCPAPSAASMKQAARPSFVGRSRVAQVALMIGC